MIDVCDFCSFQVHVSRDKVTWPGAIIKKTGEGMPNYDNNLVKGTLYITVDVDFPRGALSDDKKEGRCIRIVLLLIMLFPIISLCPSN